MGDGFGGTSGSSGSEVSGQVLRLRGRLRVRLRVRFS